jgi:ATP-dependent protease ClpP protease subunit
MKFRDTRAIKIREVIPLAMVALVIASILPSIAWGGLAEDLATVAEKYSSEEKEISRSMVVKNPDLEFSMDTKLLGNRAVTTIINISTYKAESFWQDAKLCESLGIERLDILLNSPGGAAYQGMALADELRIFKSKEIPIHIEGRGLIASAAIPILLMGDHRICSKNTVFLIHPSSIMKFLAREEMRDLKSQQEMMEMLEDMYARTVSENTTLDYETVKDMMTKDTWFTADQALEWGFVHEIE